MEVNERVFVAVSDFKGTATFWSFLSRVLMKMTAIFLLLLIILCFGLLCCCSDVSGKLCLSTASRSLYPFSFVL